MKIFSTKKFSAIELSRKSTMAIGGFCAFIKNDMDLSAKLEVPRQATFYGMFFWQIFQLTDLNQMFGNESIF